MLKAALIWLIIVIDFGLDIAVLKCSTCVVSHNAVCFCCDHRYRTGGGLPLSYLPNIEAKIFQGQRRLEIQI